jgi:xanthine dehydrogenase accessory factor
MRKLAELIVLVRGGGEVGTAIAHRLYRSHFRVCITEIASPLTVSRGNSFSEAVYDTSKTVEGAHAERTLPHLENIYRVWRNGNIPIVVDPDISVRPLIKPDVLINAMMLNRETRTRIEDAPLVIGIGPGFTIGSSAHLIVESNSGNNLGKVLIEGATEAGAQKPAGTENKNGEQVIWAEDAGVFTTEKNIGDAVLAGDLIGKINDLPITAPISGILRGLLRNETKVLSNARLIEIDPKNDKSICFTIRDQMRAIAGGALEAIMMSFNLAEPN